MSIGTQLEKLASLRDQGDLSPAEFGRAKELLLSGELGSAAEPTEGDAPRLPGGMDAGKPEQHLLIAVLSTIAAVFSGVSAALDPDALGLIAFSLFFVASVLNWIEFSKSRWRRR